MKLVDLQCKCCGATLKPDNIVEHLSIARCDHCGAIFSIEGSRSHEPVAMEQSDETTGTKQPHESFAVKPFIERDEVAMPDGIQVEVSGSEMIIRRRWSERKTMIITIFAVFWVVLIVVWHLIALYIGAGVLSYAGLIITAIGIFVGYCALVAIYNTSSIRIDWKMLTVRHKPLPWPGDLAIMTSDVEQLFCKEVENFSSKELSLRDNEEPSYTYEVHVMTRRSGRRKLVSGLDSVEQALFVEQQIERHLSIKDRPFGGEISR